MTDIQAAVGREQLKRMPEIIAARRRLAARYTDLLKDNLGIGTPYEPDWARSNFQSYSVRLPERLDQRAVMQAMLDAKLRLVAASCARIAKPAMRERPRIPCAFGGCSGSLHHPALYPQMNEQEQDTVVNQLKSAVLAQMGAVPAK